MVYWPTPYADPPRESNAGGVSNVSATITAPPPNPSTIVSDGYTFISPSVYLVYSGLVAVNDIFGAVGSSYDNLTLGYDPSILSTVEYCNTCGVTQSMDFQDFNRPPRWSVISEQYGCNFFGHSYSTQLLPESHPPADFVTDYNDLSQWIGFSNPGDAQSWELKPILDIPPALTDLDPAWKSCSRLTGIWDPPRPLVSLTGMKPVSMPPEPAVMPQPAVTQAAPLTHTSVPAMVPASPEQPARQTPAPEPATGGSSDDPGSGSGDGIIDEGPANPDPINDGGPSDPGDPLSGGGDETSGEQPEGGSGSASGDPGDNTGGSPGGSGSDPPAQDPPNQDPPNQDSPAQDPPTEDSPNQDQPSEDPPAQDAPAKVSVPFVLVTPKPVTSRPSIDVAGLPATLDDSGDIVVGDSTLSPGGPAITAAGTTISLLPNKGGIGVNGKPAAAPRPDDPPTKPDNPLPKPDDPPTKPDDPPTKPVVGIVAAGETWTPAGSGAVAAGGKTLSVGGSTVNIKGTPVSLDSDGLIAGTSTLALPVNNKLPVAWTAAGQTFTKLDDGTVVADGKTLAVGSAPQVIGGQTISFGSAGLVAGGSSTIAVPSEPAPAGAPTFAAAGETFTPVASGGIVVHGTTVTSGGRAQTIDGHVVSIGGGGLIVDDSTFAVPVPAEKPTGATFVVAGQTFTSLSPTAVAISGQTILSGKSTQTIEDQRISFGSAGLVVGASTLAIPTPVAGHPSEFSAAGETITALGHGTVVIDGTTITSGGQAKTLDDGQTVSLAAQGLIVGSSTIALPSPASAAQFKTNVFVAGSETFTRLDSTLLVDGTATITSGAAAKTVDGHTISWGASGIVIDGKSTIALPSLLNAAAAKTTSAATAADQGGSGAETGIGSLILGGFGAPPNNASSTTALNGGAKPSGTAGAGIPSQTSTGDSESGASIIAAGRLRLQVYLCVWIAVVSMSMMMI